MKLHYIFLTVLAINFENAGASLFCRIISLCQINLVKGLKQSFPVKTLKSKNNIHWVE